ncbi:slit homolog 1 protein-like [Ruditapes philippinarum]|uniref:slit homolog 1 protein-like n=1 Tax=Ruditapes philippinarum TaxID=129788 RepID=UPI00295C2C1D|nr:slit homolog 1 protein-like [Ruditapes philippinarum]
MDVTLRVIFLLCLCQLISPTAATPSDSKLEKCSWCPSCYCKDESVYTNGSYLLLVNCTDAGLTSVPTNIPSNTTVLTLNGNNITKIGPRSFEHLSKLLYLDLSKTGLTSLHSETFAGLGNLRTLELNGNKIRYKIKCIPDGVFAELKSLTRLNLQQNFSADDVEPKEQYPTKALSNLNFLEELLIDGLQNRTFANHMEKMKRLTSLTLNGFNGRCSVKSIDPKMFKFCKRINVFHILPNLLSVNLSGNFLENAFRNDLQGEIFKNQAKLEFLDISDNKIRTLPQKFFTGLKRLMKLCISNNFLLTFDVKINHMNWLTWLDISNNLLVTIATSTRETLLTLSHDTEHDLSVNLQNNKLVCSCSYIRFVKQFSEMTQHFRRLKSYTCKYESGVTKDLAYAKTIYETLQKDCADYKVTIITITSLSFLLVLVVVGSCIIYRYRWKLRYLYYSAKMRHRGYTPVDSSNDDTTEFAYDVFISYSDSNRRFVKNVLVPELEAKRHHVRVMDHMRDFIPGNFVVDNFYLIFKNEKFKKDHDFS